MKKENTVRIEIDLDAGTLHDVDLVVARVREKHPSATRDDVVNGMLVRWFAERDARRGTGEMLFEFAPAATAQEIYSEIRRSLEWRNHSAWEAEARVKAARGEALTAQEQTYVDLARARQSGEIAMVEALEALKRAGSLPADLPVQIDAEAVLRAWALMKRGKISQQRFDEEIDHLRRFPCGELEEGD
jgi:hypothetical protein